MASSMRVRCLGAATLAAMWHLLLDGRAIAWMQPTMRTASRAHGNVEAPLDEQPVFAVPPRRFRRSAMLQCRELLVSVNPKDAYVFNDYVAGFYSSDSKPLSNLHFEGRLVAGAVAAKHGGPEEVPAEVDFRIHHIGPGPWIDAQPRLQRLNLRQDPSVPQGQQEVCCQGLELPVQKTTSEVSEDPMSFKSVPLDLEMDTQRAYNWMRYGGYLEWASFLVTRILDMESPPGTLIVDLGGGSGWMAALLAAHVGGSYKVLCTDIAPEALELASVNFKKNNLPVDVMQGDLFEAVEQYSDARAKFVFFYPPQCDTGASDSNMVHGSPDVSLLTPGGDLTHFHARFCRELELAEGGIAWLAVD